MFIIIPLVFVAISLLGIAIIVRPKLPYLRKLSPDAHQVGEHLIEDYFPELVQWVNNIPWREFRKNSLREIEKLLRRLRLILLKIDHVSDRLIKRVRRTHVADHVEQVVNSIEKLPEPMVSLPTPSEPTLEDLKAQEQQLIIDISQDPKNPQLYETLGDLYVKIGSDQDAQEAYEAALGFNPDNQVLARKYSALLKKKEIAS